MFRLKKINKEVGPKLYWINTHWYANIVLKNHVTNNKEAFIYEEIHSIDKSFFSNISFFSYYESPIDRCLRKANAFSDLRFELKIENF